MRISLLNSTERPPISKPTNCLSAHSRTRLRRLPAPPRACGAYLRVQRRAHDVEQMVILITTIAISDTEIDLY